MMDNCHVPDARFDGADIIGPADLDHLKVRPDGICWWCQTGPATTGEHKFKRSDLARLVGDSLLIWGDDTGRRREIRGRSGLDRDRYKVVKFPKSMCGRCNNVRSQPFDRAYEQYAAYVSARKWLHSTPGIDFRQIYGPIWAEPVLNLARYYAKHFACRMARTGLPIPSSLTAFLDGAEDMSDAQLALVMTDTVGRSYGRGLSISPDFVTTDKSVSQLRAYVLAAYVGPIGVRYQWALDGIPDEQRSQFFHFPYPVLNHFRDERAVAEGRTSPQPLSARLLQRLGTRGRDGLTKTA